MNSNFLFNHKIFCILLLVSVTANIHISNAAYPRKQHPLKKQRKQYPVIRTFYDNQHSPIEIRKGSYDTLYAVSDSPGIKYRLNAHVTRQRNKECKWDNRLKIAQRIGQISVGLTFFSSLVNQLNKSKSLDAQLMRSLEHTDKPTSSALFYLSTGFSVLSTLASGICWANKHRATQKATLWEQIHNALQDEHPIYDKQGQATYLTKILLPKTGNSKIAAIEQYKKDLLLNQPKSLQSTEKKRRELTEIPLALEWNEGVWVPIPRTGMSSPWGT